MADKYVGDLTTATPNLTDKLLGVNGSDAYQALVSDVAKKIIEDYAGTTLMGTAQSVQSAFNGSNSLVGKNNITGANVMQGWVTLTSGQDLNDVMDAGVYVSTNATITNSLLNCPVTGGGFKMVVEYTKRSTTAVRQTITMPHVTFSYGALLVEQAWVRQRDTSSEWTPWIPQPRRSEVNAIANQGAKNLLRTSASSQTVNGITFTVNTDGSIVANGTATANAQLTLWNRASNSWYLPTGSYTLSGGASGGSSSTYELAINKTSGSSSVAVAKDYGDGGTFTVSDETEPYGAYIIIRSGQAVNNLTFYPMLRNASIQDDTYVPYGMTNAELTAKHTITSLNDKDLNDCTADGRYVSATSTTTATVTNRPTGLTNGFTMVVYSESVNPTQVIYESGSTARIYIRSKTSTQWGAWQKVTTEAV